MGVMRDGRKKGEWHELGGTAAQGVERRGQGGRGFKGEEGRGGWKVFRQKRGKCSVRVKEREDKGTKEGYPKEG